MSEFKNRNLKVYSFGNSWKNESPRILLQGRWLEAAGFEIGDHVVVEPSDGRLVISKLNNEA